MKPTKEQNSIFHFLKNRPENLVINALAGCGKTTVLVECIKILPKDKKIIFVAFNKHIKKELQDRLPDNVYCSTFHGIGTSAIKRKYGDSIKFDEFKIDHIIQKREKSWKLDSEFKTWEDKQSYLKDIKQLVNLCRLTLTLDKKYIPYLNNKYELGLRRDVDIKRVLQILNTCLTNRKSFDFNDMVFLPAIDPSIWLFPHDYVMIDEIQDINRAQQMMMLQLLKRDKITKKYKGKFIGVGDKHQCQPEGTKITMYDGSIKNIEDIKIGDLVVSYNRNENGHFVGKQNKNIKNWLKDKAPKVENISKRLINDTIVKIKSNNKISSYTRNHKVMVRFKRESLNKYALYLMRKDDKFRIGIVKLWNNKNYFASFRARQEGADDFWILNTYENKFDAYNNEQYYALTYKIPQVIFRYKEQIDNIDQKYIDSFYNRIDKEELLNNVTNLFVLFNKDIRYPFWSKDNSKYFSKNHMFELHACNILSNDMQMIHYDENNNDYRNHGKERKKNRIIKPTYSDIDGLSLEFYSGNVYSLKISKYELYVADGILTHNSIYGFTGVNEKSYEWFLKQPNTQSLPLTHTFRCGKKIVEKAKEIVPEIKALENAIDGEVRIGNVLKEPNEGDFVLCRKTRPLLELFFHYLTQGKKATINGSDLGLSIIEMIEGHKTIEILIQSVRARLRKYEADLKSRGVLNYSDDSGYITLSDKVNTIEFLSTISKDVNDMKKKITQIFRDDLQGIILSTVHKAKGLEADRVFIARPDLLPMQVQSAWQFQQEKNLEYVAYTRAKKELIIDENWSDEPDKNDEK